MKNTIDTNDQFVERRAGKSNPEGRQPLQLRERIRKTIVKRSLDAIMIEDFRIPRDVDAHEHAVPETALQLARPALYLVPTPPEIAPAVVSQTELAQAEVEHDNVAFLDDARNRVMASLPEQENYVPDHPRIDFGQNSLSDFSVKTSIDDSLEAIGYQDESYSESLDSQDKYQPAA